MAPPLILLVVFLLPALAAGHQHPSSYGSSALSEWRNAKSSYFAADPGDAIGKHQQTSPSSPSWQQSKKRIHQTVLALLPKFLASMLQALISSLFLFRYVAANGISTNRTLGYRSFSARTTVGSCDPGGHGHGYGADLCFLFVGCGVQVARAGSGIWGSTGTGWRRWG